MRKALKLFLFTGLFMIFLASCTDQYITEEHYDVWTYVKEYNVGTKQLPWIFDDKEDLFYCEIPVRELTQTIYDEGIIAAYFVYSPNGIGTVDSPLPFEDFFMDSSGYQWTHQYTCEFSPELVTFIFKDSNFEVTVPPVCTFVLKMMR